MPKTSFSDLVQPSENQDIDLPKPISTKHKPKIHKFKHHRLARPRKPPHLRSKPHKTTIIYKRPYSPEYKIQIPQD